MRLSWTLSWSRGEERADETGDMTKLQCESRTRRLAMMLVAFPVTHRIRPKSIDEHVWERKLGVREAEGHFSSRWTVLVDFSDRCLGGQHVLPQHFTQ